MKNIFILLIFTTSPKILFSQSANLIPNSGFEEYLNCPSGFGEITKATGWINPSLASPDYLNSCADPSTQISVPTNEFGFQQARTGNAYAGIYVLTPSTNYREYIEVKLDSALVAGIPYYFEMYVNLSDSSRLAADAIGAYFSNIAVLDLIFPPAIVKDTPQVVNAHGNIISDTVNWTKISGCFTAKGGERYVTIGNFYDSLNTVYTPHMVAGISAYYMLDDLLLRRSTMEPVAIDTQLCKGSSLVIDASVLRDDNAGDNIYYLWQDGSSNPIHTFSNAGIYTVTLSGSCGPVTDTVIINPLECSDCFTVPNVFTPNGDGINDDFFPIQNCTNITGYHLSVFDRWGEKIFDTTDPSAKWKGDYKGRMQQAGAYVYLLHYTNSESGKSSDQRGNVLLLR